MGKNKENRDYRMQGVILEHVTQEKDLGVVIDIGGKQAAQCQIAIGEANRGLGCIRRGIIYKSKEVVLTLYRNLVRFFLNKYVFLLKYVFSASLSVCLSISSSVGLSIHGGASLA